MNSFNLGDLVMVRGTQGAIGKITEKTYDKDEIRYTVKMFGSPVLINDSLSSMYMTDGHDLVRVHKVDDMVILNNTRRVPAKAVGRKVVIQSRRYEQSIDRYLYSVFISEVGQYCSELSDSDFWLDESRQALDASYWLQRQKEQPRKKYNEIFSYEEVCDLLHVPEAKRRNKMIATLDIDKVVFSGDKTIILWKDGTKTMVGCMLGDTYDYYAGFCAAVTKKIFGSTANAQRLMGEKSIFKDKDWYLRERGS